MDSEKCKKCTFSRREFLEKTLQGVGVLSASSLVLTLMSCSQEPLPSGGPSGGNPSDGNPVAIPKSSSDLYSFAFADYPTLQNTGGSIHVRIQATSGAKDIYITRVDPSTVLSLSTVCTHAGCTVGPFDPNSQEYICPCHNSIFGADGHVISGPAPIPLPSFPTVLTSTGVDVTVK